ncbi:hypothetical protein IQ277_26655 [Nostocales cyanobacterium LEGE 12452]|nr:hypothetical protein [Nostocales cyanobacterium LEGE 12452]
MKKYNILLILFLISMTAILAGLLWVQISTFTPTKQNLNTDVESLKREGKIRDVQLKKIINKQQRNSPTDKTQDKYDNLQSEISTLNSQLEVLKAKIETLGNQQQNFITGAIGFFGIITASVVIREIIVSNQLKENLKVEIIDSISTKINKIIWLETEAMKRQQKWLEYKTALLSAEQLKYDAEQDDKFYRCIAAIYEHLRAIRILAELSENINNLEAANALFEHSRSEIALLTDENWFAINKSKNLLENEQITAIQKIFKDLPNNYRQQLETFISRII